jgi:TetR/AcrR family transcriptional repressor of nem operon
MQQQTTTPNKRQRLIRTAAELVHQHGFQKTTLADIATKANIPLGSIYYYFRSREELARAVVERRVAELGKFLERQASEADPRKRLEALVHIWVDERKIDAEFGCPVGSLCYELAKGRGPMSGEAARPFNLLLAWCETQFHLMGNTRDAGTLALHLIAALQGISLIANALGDSEQILRETTFLERWLREVDGRKKRPKGAK